MIILSCELNQFVLRCRQIDAIIIITTTAVGIFMLYANFLNVIANFDH